MKLNSYQIKLCFMSLIKYMAVIIMSIVTYIYDNTYFLFDGKINEYIFTGILIIMGIVIIAPMPFFFFQGTKYFSAINSSTQSKSQHLRKFFLVEILIAVLLVLTFYSFGTYYDYKYNMSISSFMAISRDWSLLGKSVLWFFRMVIMIGLGLIGIVEWGLCSIGFLSARKSLK